MGAAEKVSRYNLITGEDTYASQTSQNPATARKLASWIPADDGQLTRELLDVKFNTTQLSGPVVGLYEYDWNDLTGTVNRTYFAAARTDFNPGTQTCNLYFFTTAGPFVQVASNQTTINPLAGVPACVTINNLFHVTDGSYSYVYDGPNNVWYIEGYFTTTEFGSIDTQSAGSLTLAIGRYYWIGYADHTHNHESDAITFFPLGSVNTLFTGPITSKEVKVYPFTGLASCSPGSGIVTRSSSGDNPGPSAAQATLLIQPGFYDPSRIRFGVWINGTQLTDSFGNPVYVVNNTPVNLVLNAHPTQTITNGRAVLAPLKTTHWHLYASEVDGSQVGQQLGEIPLTQNLSTTPFIDQDPGISSPSSLFLPIFRPVRNDEPPPSKILEVHKYRQWRVRKNRPTFFSFSANEEVTSGANGSPQESWPGTDTIYGTFSDIVNEYPYPDQSNNIRALISHADALYIFSEKQGLPLYGESLDDFALSQVTAFAVGIAGQFAGTSTPSGLAFLSYDRMLFLYPTSNYPWAYVPKDVNVTDSLIDIGKPQRKSWEQIQFADMNKTWVRNYRFGRRNWLVVSAVLNSTSWQTLVYDFNTKGWFHLQQGFQSLATFEVSNGAKILVGGGSDGFVYVADDISGTYVSTGPHPNAVWRPALIDFGAPDDKHVFMYVELEFSSPALEADTRINYYLDPPDVDNPGTPRTLILQKVKNVGANLYRGWATGGNACHRLLLEVNTAASTNVGSIRSAKLVACKIVGLVN
jgi:hypothetical protein